MAAARLAVLVALGVITGADAAGAPGLEARVGAIERKFEGELAEMRGELKRMGSRLEVQHERAEAQDETVAGLRQDMAKMQRRQVLCETSVGQAVAVIESKRRLQDEARCQGAPMQAMLAACCPDGRGAGGQHRRELQGGCTGFPASCSAECAALFVEYYEGCQGLIAAMPAGEKSEFDSFFRQCSEAAQAAAGMMQPVQVQMYRIRLSTEAGQDQNDMFPGGDSGAGQPVAPVGPAACWSGAYTADRCCDVANGPTGDSSCWSGSFDFEFCCPADTSPGADDTGNSESSGIKEYHAECRSAEIATCVPACSADHHGFELLATIDGTDTKFSCNLAHGLYSWMGAASEGGYLGGDGMSFFSAVSSGAAGTYAVVLMASPPVGSTLTVEFGQNVNIVGGTDDQLPWGTCLTNPPTGLCNSGFEVKETAKLSLDNMVITGRMLVHGGEIRLHGCRVQGANALAFPRDTSVIGDPLNDRDGGGLKMLSNAIASVLNCEFVENYGRDGAAIYADRTATLTLEQTTFTRNFGGALIESFIVRPEAIQSQVHNSGSQIMVLKRKCGRSPCQWSGHRSDGDYSNEEANAAQPLFVPACTQPYPECV